MTAPSPPLGGLSPEAFLRGYWQKRPLLVRQAIPEFTGLIDKRGLFELASSEQAESRLVERSPDWQVTPGPFSRRRLGALPPSNWTLLVNGLNHHSAAADALLESFSFASWARLDDVMASYAVDKGGVGPHVDSYDVFLLQGPGRRRWRLMPPQRAPFGLVRNVPIKLIAQFRPSEEMVLEAGDMLYLPPGWGHEGTAIGTCQTYSIGFRTPGAVELSTAFLDFLHERGFDEEPYRDPGRTAAAHPAEVDEHLVDHASRVLRRIRWDKSDVARFLGRYLSEPRQHVVFDPPLRPIAMQAFVRKLASAKVRLDPRTRMLSHGTHLYVNGVAFAFPARGGPALRELGDRREIQGARLARTACVDLVFDWYRQGFLLLEKNR